MVRISDVFGPSGFKTPEKPKSPLPPLPAEQRSEDVPPSAQETHRRTEEKKHLQEEGEALYLEGLALIQDLFEKARRDESLSMDTIKEFVKRVLFFMTGDGDPLLIFTSGISSGNFLYAHSLNALILSLKVGFGLRYDKVQLLELGLTAFLHDIGMAKVPEEILNKPEKLTPEEF